MVFVPKINILPPAQRAIWPYLCQIPDEFVLYGGTAVALRYGHRNSLDFDFFTNFSFGSNLRNYIINIPFIKDTLVNIEVISDKQINFLVLANDNKLTYAEKTVKLTFLADNQTIPCFIQEPDVANDNGLKIASPIDLLATKLLAIYGRLEARDFIDIVQLLKNGLTLQQGFQALYTLANEAGYSVLLNFDTLKDIFLQQKCLDYFNNQADYQFLINYVESLNFDELKLTGSATSLKSNIPSEIIKKNEINYYDFLKSLVWYDDPEMFTNKDKFLLFILSQWPSCYYRVKEKYGISDDEFIQALKNAYHGSFTSFERWIDWNKYFKIEPCLPFPGKFIK
jgi:hypothetical protein